MTTKNRKLQTKLVTLLKHEKKDAKSDTGVASWNSIVQGVVIYILSV